MACRVEVVGSRQLSRKAAFAIVFYILFLSVWTLEATLDSPCFRPQDLMFFILFSMYSTPLCSSLFPKKGWTCLHAYLRRFALKNIPLTLTLHDFAKTSRRYMFALKLHIGKIFPDIDPYFAGHVHLFVISKVRFLMCTAECDDASTSIWTSLGAGSPTT